MASADADPAMIIDQLRSKSSEGSTRCATSITSMPVLKAMMTASTAIGISSSRLRLQLTAAAAKAPVQRPSIRVLSAL